MAEFKNLPHMEYNYEKPDVFSIDPMKPIIEEIISDFRTQQEDNIMKAVADVGIFVDKPRLIQALTDAKAFYEEGYIAGKNSAVVEVRHGEWKLTEPDSDVRFFCSECEAEISTSWDYDNPEMWSYCPNCGAKMDGKGEGE